MSKDNANFTSLKELLSCDSSRRVFNTLVTVRKLISKDKNGVAKMLAASVISKIVEILRTQDPESEHTSTADIILSILGNMAMDTKARLAICQAGGVGVVANQFVKTSVPSIQLRSCRVLANLAIDRDNCQVIAECDDVFLRTVKLLQEASNVDLITVCCRALRLFGQTAAERKKLIGHGAVLPLSKLLKKDDSQLVTSSLRSLCELSASGCSGSFAQQVLDANILEELVKLVDDADNTTSQNALSLLLHLTDISDIRPSIGAAGGIPLLIRLMTDQRTHVNKISVINAICLCGKEAVNRVKIREHGGLQLFLKSLQDKQYSVVHDRLISGLVCFHYDDASIDVLLDNELVSVLLQHLQRSAHFVSVAESLDVKTQVKRIRDTRQSSPAESVPRLCDMSVAEGGSGLRSTSMAEVSPGVHNTSVAEVSLGMCNTSVDEVSVGVRNTSVDEVSPGVRNTSVDEVSPDTRVGQGKRRLFDKSPVHPGGQKTDQSENEAGIKDEKPGSSHDPVFSIDSPTYTINTEWTMVSTSVGVGNRQRLSTNSSVSPRLPAAQYSPLSNESVMSSPSMCSSLFSPPSSPASATSPLNIDMYGPIGSKSYMCSSSPPKFSPLGWSPPGSHGSDDVCTWHYSSEEDEEDPTDLFRDIPEKEQLQESITAVKDRMIHPSPCHQADECSNPETTSSQPSQTKVNTAHTSGGSFHNTVCVKPTICEDVLTDTVDMCVWKGKRTVSARSPESQTLDLTENIPKRSKPDSTKPNILKTTEKNILILLSRISVKTDPSPYLIVSPVLSCLLDYLTLSSTPQSRCIRTLSRLLRNPHCLEPLLRIAAPVFIYKNLLLNDEGVDNSAYQLFNRKKTERRSSWSPQSSDSSFSISYDLDLSKYRLVADPQPSSPVRMEHDFDYDSGRSLSGNNCALDDWVIDVAGTGLSLLKDLSFSAASPFGRGVISHILLRKEKHIQILCSVCLLYLCWSPGMQQHYLISMKVIDKMLSFLQSGDVGPLFSAILCGVIFLVKMVDRPSALKQTGTRDSFRSIFAKSASADFQSSCHYKKEHFDLFFLIGDKRIGSNRKTLINKSSVFSAMLEGHYTEASQSEITIPCISHDALLYVLHYLHGCDLNCSVVLQMEGGEVEENVLVDVSLDVLALADQYLLTDLAHYMKVILSSRLLSSDSIARILQFSVFHDFRDLCMDCVKELFFLPVSISCKSSIIHELMNTGKAQTLTETIRQLIGEGAKYP
ncbi:uncharacterized protein LOC121369340 [Gigantopelta aegis]|uniref:uncharacterized protein LOC121369340 n=1 Tax=Gigantopelta aegis TaxID=1735272 RepID=UPI001B88AF4E|nr:uncharacterized protein LOC121369340 [Gigantopelta aegis]